MNKHLIAWSDVEPKKIKWIGKVSSGYLPATKLTRQTNFFSMSTTDKWITIIVVAIIVIYLGVLIAGIASHKLLSLISLVNLVTAISILVYWLQHQIRISQHIIDLLEIVGLCIETGVITCAALALKRIQYDGWLKIVQYLVFGIHLLALICFLLFMLFFKMNRMVWNGCLYNFIWSKCRRIQHS